MPENTVSIDRITIVGEIKSSFLELAQYLGKRWEFKSSGFQYVRQVDEHTENIAWLEESKYKQYSWRLDFNPNRLTEIEIYAIKNVVTEMVEPHFSRLDIALDVFNNELAMKHRLYRWNVSEHMIETFNGRDKSVETIYWGARKSEQQVRLYDKYKEQKAKGKDIPEGVHHWARLELQLRGKKPTEWQEATHKMLSDFKIADLKTIDNVNDRIALYGIESGVVEWTDFAKAKRANLRKLIKDNQGYDNSLSLELEEIVKRETPRLQNELQKVLVDFGIKG